MAKLCAKVELHDEDDRVILIEYAYGNTPEEVTAAAGVLRTRMERAAESEYPGCNGIIGRTVRA